MERLPTSRDFNDHFDLGTIALLLTKASEESMTWPRVLINEQKDPNTLPNQAATTSGILHYLKGFRIAHQSIIAQIKKRYPEEVTQVKEDVEHQTAQLSTFTREILDLIPEITSPEANLRGAISDLARHRRRLIRYAMIAQRIMEQQTGKTELDIRLRHLWNRMAKQ